MTAGNLLAGILFSAIGIGATIHARRTRLWKPMIIGIALMVYPYFVPEAWQTVLVGAALTACLFVFRD